MCFAHLNLWFTFISTADLWIRGPANAAVSPSHGESSWLIGNISFILVISNGLSNVFSYMSQSCNSSANWPVYIFFWCITVSPVLQSNNWLMKKNTRWRNLIVFLIVVFLSYIQDYYGLTFPGTTAAMPGRDLATNPYSGKSNFVLNMNLLYGFYWHRPNYLKFNLII